MKSQLKLKNALLTLLLLAISVAGFAQKTAVKGRVLDLETQTPILGASIMISNSKFGATTDANGEFKINLPDANTEIVLVGSYVGYETDSLKYVVNAGNLLTAAIFLVSKSSTLDEVVITKKRERFTELALLEERKLSNLMVEKIGAQELSRKGVSDAEGALTKMSGVTKSASGANVFVRGLGDRYNSTTFNGLALPSEDPLNKNISLDFFGTSIIQSIAVNKTFNPQLSGDVAGANIDILAKELTEQPFFEIGASAGINSQAVRANDFKRISGTNWFGSLKESKHAINDFSKYSFKNNWDPKNVKNPVNSAFSLAGGKRFKVGEGNLDAFVTANFGSEYRYFNGVSRQTTQRGSLVIDQEMERSQYNVSKTAMANLKYSFGKHHVSFNSLFIGNQNQDFGNYYGKNESVDIGDKRLFRRSHVVNNNLYVNQLLSTLNLTDNWKLDLGAGYNIVDGNEPDRRTTNLYERDGVIRVLNDGRGSDNERYYSNLSEKGWTAKAFATYKFNNDDNLDRKIEFGYNGNAVKRDFNATLFVHNLRNELVVDNIDASIDNIFNQSSLSSGKFDLETARGTSLDPYWYTGDKKVHAAAITGTYQFNEKLTALLGIRYDKVLQEVEFVTQSYNSELAGPSKIDKDFFLPSLNLKYNLTDKSNLRASASKSYTLPQFIELAPFRNSFATYKSEGNKDLIPVENLNFDIKWEIFPSNGELFAIGAFYKQLKNPIARSEIPVAGNTVTYFNVGSTAKVVGAEVEVKKNLLKTESTYGENVLSVGANLSYLYSKQDLATSIAQFTKDESALQGASPFLANADVSYMVKGANWNLNSSFVFNYFSDRIYAIGTNDFNNIVEKGVPILDFVTTATIKKKWGLNLKARNILNAAIELSRESDSGEDIVLESYKRGVDVSVGVSYKF